MLKILKGMTREERTTYNQKYYAENRTLLLARSVAQRKAHPDRIKAYRQKHKLNERNRSYLAAYGITFLAFESQIAKQNNLCPIGFHLFGPVGQRKGDSPCMDHDHKTGKNRMVLCYTHNVALGGFHDSAVELQAAIDYLKQFESGE